MIKLVLLFGTNFLQCTDFTRNYHYPMDRKNSIVKIDRKSAKGKSGVKMKNKLY